MPQSIQIGNIKLDGFVYIPPMAGVTDLAYRELCRAYDPFVLLSCEMLSSKALIHAHKHQSTHKHQRRLDIPENDMGCPVPKIVKGRDGAALMREPDLACDIVRAVKSATNLPVTVKTRLGWCQESINAPELAKRFEDLGVSALTIHGRTRAQKYTGIANWELIGSVVKAVKIPVFANGDIRSLEDALKVLKITGSAGMAIARGTMGKPWFSRQVNHFLKTGEILPEPSIQERLELAIKHCELLVRYKGEHTGIQEARRHINNYTSGLPGAGQLRARINNINNLQEAQDAISELMLNSLV
jgi:tRNA-dihydrouridine synthase B